MAKQRVGILTGGGDAPGLNAVIRGVTKSATNEYGMEVLGFHDGFLGLIEGRFDILTDKSVSGILTQGGTILGTSNKADPYNHWVIDGNERKKMDVSNQCMQLYHDLGLTALICLGGDGTMRIAGRLAEKGANVVGVPKTIDKDVVGTDVTFGFDTARNMATEAIDRLHTTADSHHRVMLVEVMGRNAGWLALESGIAGGGDIVLIPEIPYDMDVVLGAVRKRNRFGKRFSIVVVAEGAKPLGGVQTVRQIVADSPDPIRFGGVCYTIAAQIEKDTGIECRATVLGHLQRGGTPTPFDRLLATQFAVKAVQMVVAGEFNRMAAVQGSTLTTVPIASVVGQQRKIPLDSQLIDVAYAVGTCLGANVRGTSS